MVKHAPEGHLKQTGARKWLLAEPAWLANVSYVATLKIQDETMNDERLDPPKTTDNILAVYVLNPK